MGKKILVVTHGKLAEGLVSAAELILGQQDHLYYINAYIDDKPLIDHLKEFIKNNIVDADRIIILTDLFGGSVNQKVIELYSQENVHIISGVNLPLIIEAVMLDKEGITEERLAQLVEDSSKQIIYVNDIVKKDSADDDFDF